MREQKAKEKIKKLVVEYENLKQKNELKDKNEAFTKQRFIQPFFEALGWNFRKDVWPEETVSKDRVDYAFKIGDFIKFFLEAKKFSVDLDEERWAKQAIDYAWNKSVIWAVLTDFEGLKIFNSEWNKKPYRAVKELQYNEYIKRFDEIWLLSKESIEKDELNKIAEDWGVKEKKVPVSEELANDLTEWRGWLTEEIKICNKGKYDNKEIDEAVQRFLDRLIFIRYAEDKGLEPLILEPLVKEVKIKSATDIIKKLNKIFRQFDAWYDSRLFEKHFSEDMEAYSGKIEKIMEGLYRSKKTGHPYDFSAISVDVLGAVYEQYLGHIQKKGNNENNGKSKRKEQGIYYTPKYIVDYIVQNTLGEILKQKMPNEVRKIKVLDPACGSGSFLISAYQTLLDYFQNPANYKVDAKSKIGQFEKAMLKKKGVKELSAAEKMNILRENVYGVDLDEQAVEIAQLNLNLKAISRRTKLPNLSHKIVCGNSLIFGSEKELKEYFGNDWKNKKPFNWQKKFNEVFKQGGFDVIIGNPPYIFARGGSFEEKEKKYYYDFYKLQQYQINTFLLFIERGINLLKNGGYFGFIIPNNWLTINTFSKLREYLLKNTSDLKIINIIDKVFQEASVDSCLLLFQKGEPTIVELGEIKEGELILNKFKRKDFYQNDFLINIAKSKTEKNNKILEKISKLPLSSITKVSTGIKAYQIGKGKPIQTKEIKDGRKFHSDKKINETYLPYLSGVDVKRYSLIWSGEYLSYGDWLAEPRKSVPFKGDRILVRQIPSQPPYCINGVLADKEYINDINSMIIFNPVKGYVLRYILGIINSQLISYWFINTFDKFQRKIFPQFKVNELAKFPIFPADKKQQKPIIDLVNKMLKLNKEIKNITENSDKYHQLKKEIEKTDKEIDKKVYELYGLTEEEIKIVESK